MTIYLKCDKIKKVCEELEIVYYFIGMAIAAVVGYMCIKLMLAVVRKKKFTFFAVYCFIVGALSIGGYFYMA